MSDEQLHALGMKRRGFLKRTATAAFVAPVVVSFGLDGIAEAAPGPNQCFSNQFYSNQTLNNVSGDLNAMLAAILQALNLGQLEDGLARDLAHRVLEILLDVAGGQPSTACDKLQAFVNEVNSKQSKLPYLASTLLNRAQKVQGTLGCVCS